jgi:hypothetical protein
MARRLKEFDRPLAIAFRDQQMFSVERAENKDSDTFC